MPPFHWWKTVFFLIPSIGIYTIVLGLLSLLGGLFEPRGVWAHRCAQWWSRAILATSGVRYTLRGAPLPPPDTSCIFVANHASIYDIPILFTAIPRQLRIMAKATLGYFPFIGWHLQRSGHLLVDRTNPGASIFKKMQRMTRHGASLIVFPEGSRTSDGRVMKFKGGMFLLAIENKLPVVPITVSGSRVVMPKGRLMVCPADVVVTVHEPIATAEMTREDARSLAAKAREIVASALPHRSPDGAAPADPSRLAVTS
ncbi:MAG TPA: lysophospholipid acyltransferase family protein [Vicinamibacterales bacterium]|nr:lysophospholipid acyltransferase family protein [Vicinamibacterales bacterium]